jgi:P27 family predicted phage terminase small subunit
MPGPRRTPAHVLTARGSSWPAPGHGAVLAAAPAEVPPPPDWLPPAAKARYVEVADFLRAAGALATSDLPVIVRYCVTWAKWAAAEQRLATGEETEFIQTSGRYGDRVVPSAARRTSSEAARELARLERVLGLSPADRVGLGLSAPAIGAENDPVERLLSDAWAEPSAKPCSPPA